MALTAADTSGSDACFARLGAELDALAADGRVRPASVPDDGSHAGRGFRIARTWLWLLGYLERDDGSEAPDAAFDAALASFRSERGLAAAEGLDAATTTELERLVLFDPGEAPLGGPAWPAVREADTAELRAIGLRLFSYHFLAERPRLTSAKRRERFQRDLEDAVASFADLARRVGYEDDLHTPLDDPRLTALLFDHERLVRGLHLGTEGFLVEVDGLGSKGRKQLRGFFMALAGVELWLLGYDVRPGSFRAEGPHGRERDGTFFSELRRFARDHELDVPSRDLITVGPWFFEASRRLLDERPADGLPDEEVDAALADESVIREVRREYTSLGARLLDGARRVLRGVMGWIRRSVRVLAVFARNLARASFGLASGVYERIRAMFEIARRGASYLFARGLPGSRADALAVVKDADFDFVVFVHRDCPRDAQVAFLDAMMLHVRAFALGGRILGRLWELVEVALRLGRGPVGWLALVLSLVKLGSWLQRTAEVADEALALRVAFDGLDAAAV